MCTFDKKLKLCTCAGEVDKKQPYWELYRGISGHGIDIIEGFFMPPEQAEIDIGYLINSQLNENDTVFDFEYSPLDGDSLTLHFKRQHFTFVYSQDHKMWISNHWNETKHTLHLSGKALFE